MSYSEADAELWDTDPYEYIRIKFDIFEVKNLISETSRKIDRFHIFGYQFSFYCLKGVCHCSWLFFCTT
jgi:hypothetical protein